MTLLEKEGLEEIMVDRDEISGANFERFLKLFVTEETAKMKKEEEEEGEGQKKRVSRLKGVREFISGRTNLKCKDVKSLLRV